LAVGDDVSGTEFIDQRSPRAARGVNDALGRDVGRTVQKIGDMLESLI
jgi:hypothetical protein